MTTMLQALKFVQGAVSKKELIPAMTHFVIENGVVRAFNGNMALCSPIPFNVDCKPKAQMLIKAITNCEDVVAMNLTPAGRLSIKSGPFSAFIDCHDEETPYVEPEGDFVDINGEELLKALEACAPFMGTDASRVWSNGVLLDGECAYATNNVTLIEYWTEAKFPMRVIIPSQAVKEMLRINEAPKQVRCTERSITFYYSDDRWLRAQLLNDQFPNIERILNREHNAKDVPVTLFDAIEKIKPFLDKNERVYLHEGQVSSVDIVSKKTEGVSYDVDGLEHEGIYVYGMIMLLKGVATKLDLGAYPNPCMFFGERLRGAIVGRASGND